MIVFISFSTKDLTKSSQVVVTNLQSIFSPIGVVVDELHLSRGTNIGIAPVGFTDHTHYNTKL